MHCKFNCITVNFDRKKHGTYNIYNFIRNSLYRYISVIIQVYNMYYNCSYCIIMNWIAFWKKNCYRIDSINSIFHPESPKVSLGQLQQVFILGNNRRSGMAAISKSNTHYLTHITLHFSISIGILLCLVKLVTLFFRPQVYWYRDGTRLMNEGDIYNRVRVGVIGRKHILTVSSISADRDSGMYTCHAINNIGEAKENFQIMTGDTFIDRVWLNHQT